MTPPAKVQQDGRCMGELLRPMTKFIPPVAPKHFEHAMDLHWTSLGNKSSPALRESWFEQGCAYGHQIFNHDNDEAPDKRTNWVVLNPPTGAGKTEGLMLYCSMMAGLPLHEHPGVLIVTRTIKGADLVANRINELSGKSEYAISFHSENSANIARDTLSDYSVLVITHAAYETALTHFRNERAFSQTWPAFYNWQKSGRRLVIIDEAPSLLESTQVELDGLRRTLSMVPQSMRGQHADEIKVISDLIEILEKQAAQDKCEECIVPRYIAENGKVNMISLAQSMKNIAFNEDLDGESSLDNKRLCKTHKDRLMALQQVVIGDMYYARVRGKHTLNSSHLIVPDGIKGAIILDATAVVNVMYELFDKVEMRSMPKGIRRYANVQLHVSRGQSVGKTYLKENADAVLLPVIADLNERLTECDIFFATHIGIKTKVQSAPTKFKKSVGTWGAIDGSNEWKDCDTAVIIGLPTKPDTWSANMVNGFRGMQSTEWLRGPDRPFKGHSDVRAALKIGDTITQVVQAINRIRCRKVIDAEGNCPEANVYLLLPDGPWGKQILQGIINLMDGIVVKPWVIQGFQLKETKRGRPFGMGTAVNPLLDLLFDMPVGKISKAEVMEISKVSVSTFKRFVIETKTEDSRVWRVLNELGVTYFSGKGKNAETYFNKMEQVQQIL
jgi:hypothetical protein